jgi:DNA-3-methyladenine glycosylase
MKKGCGDEHAPKSVKRTKNGESRETVDPMILDQPFYTQDTVNVARQLLGCFFLHEEQKGTTVGRIVETEAYLADDPASHAFRGKTPRNAVMFGPAGNVYVYFIYGRYYCVNVVTGTEGVGEAVLLRALEPIAGIELMQQRRHTSNLWQLCSGPGKLTQAMDITLRLNGSSLLAGPLKIASADHFGSSLSAEEIIAVPRVGIVRGKEAPLRFYLRGNRFVSRT